MSHGTFVTFGSTYSQDHAAKRLQRYHAERKAREEREDRASEWVAAKMAGQTFHSFETLTAAAVRAFEAHVGRPATSDEIGVLTNAARCLWGGVTLRARTRITLTDTGHVDSLTFTKAA